MGYNSSINLGLARLPETQEPELFTEAYKIYNALFILAATLDSYTGHLQPDSSIWSQLTANDTILSGGMNRLYVIAGSAITAGQMCNLYNVAGVLKAQPAAGAAWAGGDVRGFATADIAAGDFGEIILGGLDTHVTGLTPGTLYYASNATAGGITATKPNANGNHVQPVGYALSATTLFFAPSTLAPILNVGTLAIPVLQP
jgi:hypothetical protein